METPNRSDLRPNNALYYRFIKRLFDIVFSSVTLILLSPLMIIIALAIWITDGRPIFFSQKRAGLNGKPFYIYKFRSMVINAPELLNEHLKSIRKNGPVWEIPDDPRVTKIGAFLRSTDLDELPQLVNILRSEMSVVGPRPLTDYETNLLTPYQRQRLLMKPGMTGYWQIHKNENISFDKCTEMDLNYIRKAGVWTDFKSLLKSIPAILTGKGCRRQTK